MSRVTLTFITGFIYLQGFEQNDDEENGPPTPDLDSVSQNQVSVFYL